MRIFADRRIRRLMLSLAGVTLALAVGLWVYLYCRYGELPWGVVVLSLCPAVAVLSLCWLYFKGQDELMEDALGQTRRFLSGDRDARIDCLEEGELFSFFQSVNDLASTLNAHAEREKQRSDFLKNTISDISHQLKTPLAALNIYNELIAQADSTDEVCRFTAASERELDRMGDLIQALLKLTRLDAGAITMEMQPENLADIMAELKERFIIRASSEGKEIRLEGGDDILSCDSGWLSEALGNIVKNSLDHTDQGGLITISWRRQGDMQSITLSDNGSGIHPEDIHHIFKRFYRSRFSSDTQGVGLGLPLAKAIIDAHGGTVEVESEPGKGTVFSIRLPLCPTKM